MFKISRRGLTAVLAVALLAPGAALAADPVKEIRVDWATYNPVSMVMKDKGLLEKEFEKDGIRIRWVQSAGSNKALEFLNAGSIDFGSTAGSAALVAKINGNPIKSIYVYSQPEWTALVRRILLPAVLPSYIVSLRSGLGLGWMFVVAAELLGASEGLGYLLMDGQQLGKPAQIVAAIVAFAVIGKTTDWLIEVASAPLLRWQDAYGQNAGEA